MHVTSPNIGNNSLEEKVTRYIFYFLLFIIPLIFFTNLTQNPFYIQIVLLPIIVCVILFVYLLRVNFDKEFKIITTPLDTPLFFLIIVCTVSLIFSIFRSKDNYLAIFLMGLDNIFFLFLNWIAIFYITIYTLQKTRYIRNTINLLFVVGGIASLYGILQYMNVEPIWSKSINYFGGRCVSTFGNPNFLASFLVLLLPIALTKLILVKNIYNKLFLFVVTILMFTALVCTSTRSAWIGFIISLIIIWTFLIFKIKDIKTIKRHFIYFIIIGGISLVIISSVPGKKVIGQRALSTVSIEKSGTSSSQRFLIWKCAQNMFMDSPFIGLGWGTLELFYPYYQGKYLKNSKYSSLKTHANRAHNEIFQFLSEVGIIGLGIAIWLLIIFVKCSLKLLKRTSSNKECQYIILGLFSGIIGMLIDNLFNVSLHFASPAMVFWVNTGIIISIGNQFADEQTRCKHNNNSKNLLTTAKNHPLQADEEVVRDLFSQQNSNFRFWGLHILKHFFNLVILFILLWIIWLNYNQFQAAIHYFKGLKYSKSEKMVLDKASFEFERSCKLYPFDVNANYELANIYVVQNKLDKAIEYYEKANLINFGYDEIYYNLGVIYAIKGETKKSIYNFQKALEIDPNLLDAYLNLGKIYTKIKNWVKAQEMYQRVILLNPSLVTVHLDLGCIYLNLQNIEKAISEYEEVIELDPQNLDAYKNLGDCYLRLQKNKEAKEIFEKILIFNPNDQLIKDKLRKL